MNFTEIKQKYSKKIVYESIFFLFDPKKTFYQFCNKLYYSCLYLLLNNKENIIFD